MDDRTMRAPAARSELFSLLVASKPPREKRATAAAFVAAVLFHAAIFAGLVWATLGAAGDRGLGEHITYVEIVPDLVALPVPRPPEPAPAGSTAKPDPASAAAPPVAAEEDPDVSPALRMPPPPPPPPDLAIPEIPPPVGMALTGGRDILDRIIAETDSIAAGFVGGKPGGEGKALTVEDIEAGPVFTPYRIAPELKNRDQVRRVLERSYPRFLLESRIGGRVLVWLLIDEAGNVRKYQIKESSGQDALDKAAEDVIDVMEFTPARDDRQPVPVWVSIPIVFQVE
ncbi:MAG TPA: energy transducer TonB [Longimicrobiales bacterium]